MDPSIPIWDPLRVKLARFSAAFLQMTHLIKSASLSPSALVKLLFTARVKLPTGVPD